MLSAGRVRCRRQRIIIYDILLSLPKRLLPPLITAMDAIQSISSTIYLSLISSLNLSMVQYDTY